MTNIIQLNLTEHEAEVLKVGFTFAVTHVSNFRYTVQMHPELLTAYSSLVKKLNNITDLVGKSVLDK